MAKITVTDQVLRNLILQTYHLYNIPATGRLSIFTLEQEWRETGLRDSDLLQGVESLIADGHLQYLRVDEHQDEPCLRLSESGYALMKTPATHNLKTIKSWANTRQVLRKTTPRAKAAAQKYHGPNRRDAALIEQLKQRTA